ncbi:MAG: phosphatidylglycerophosphatase A [Deltaproteobacteria bacterium]|nr:phosphatidylglycerophosphatase A [Deltaproteobacteria bacterium]
MVTGAGTGYFPWLPGTAGTLVAVPVSLAFNRIATVSLPLALLTLGVFFLVAVWLADKGEEIFREKDSPRIVIDEMAGFVLANFLAPPQLPAIGAAFLVFRIFDIIKLFPAARAEKMAGGVGVVLDDLIAGLYTFMILRLLFFWGVL